MHVQECIDYVTVHMYVLCACICVYPFGPRVHFNSVTCGEKCIYIMCGGCRAHLHIYVLHCNLQYIIKNDIDILKMINKLINDYKIIKK